MQNHDDIWWAVARSEEVTSAKPLSVEIADQPIVLWRNQEGRAMAVEDRCPHRRAPLSLGCIRDNGWIQCGYHGWSFEGESGRLKEIPNLKDQQKFPPVYKVDAFAAAEAGGFVRVCLKPKAGLPPPRADGPALNLAGTVNVCCEHQHYLNALFDDPGLVIAIRGVHFTPYLASDLREEDGWLVMERNCQWSPLHWPAHFVAEFPLTLRIKAHPLTGEVHLTLRDPQLRDLLNAVLAAVPSVRGVTAVRWRAALGVRHWRLRGRNPLSVRPSIDGSKLRKTNPSISLHGAMLRDATLDRAPIPDSPAASAL